LPVLEKLKDELIKSETIEEDEAAELMKDSVLPKGVVLH